MNRTLLIIIPELTEKHKETVVNACSRLGFEPYFCANSADAEQYSKDAEIVLGNAPALVECAPQLKWMCTPSAGINQFLSVGPIVSGNVLLSNSSGAYGVTIAEHAIMLLLEVLRRRSEYNEIVAKRQWIRTLPIKSIFGSRITMLGTGDIGRKTAQRLRAFCPKSIIGVNRGGKNPNDIFDRVYKQSELSDVLSETDILICSIPGTNETLHILADRNLSYLPDGAVIINVGRGSVIDQAALEKQLREGRLYAGLDVFEKEPIPADDPIWNCPNLLITPHSAGNLTLPHTVDRIVEMFLEDLENYAAERPLKYAASIKAGY